MESLESVAAEIEAGLARDVADGNITESEAVDLKSWMVDLIERHRAGEISFGAGVRDLIEGVNQFATTRAVPQVREQR